MNDTTNVTDSVSAPLDSLNKLIPGHLSLNGVNLTYGEIVIFPLFFTPSVTFFWQ